jgi:GPH family glycoside/pentoside/hexuronide:cation symporter
MANYRIMGIVLGLFSLSTIILTPIFVKEKGEVNSDEDSLSILASIKKTLTNRNFLNYLIPYLAVWFGINTLTISMPYISEVLLGMSPESSGFLIAGTFIVAAAFSPVLPKITLRFGKKKVMVAASVGFGLILLLMGLFGTVFTGVTAYILTFLAGIPLAAALVVPNAMVADIAEADAIKNGERREGMFFGAQGLVNKLVIGLSSLVTPLLFSTFGNTVSQPLGLQLVGPTAGIVIIICTIFLRNYSLTEEKLEDMRES